MYTPIYVTVSQVQSDPALKDIIPKSWTTDDPFLSAIAEAESCIESKIFPLGYQRRQLVTVPAVNPPAILAQSIFTIVMNYIRYVLTRDIFSNEAPQEGSGMRFDKYKKINDDTITKLEKHSSFFYDITGIIINPATPDSRYMVGSNTLDATRIITMDRRDATFRNDGTNSDESVIGLKA